MLNNKQIIIVIGCPRSGTTLMQSQLSKYFNLSALIETHFIPIFNKYLYLWSNCRNFHARLKLIDAINEFTKIRWVIGSGYPLSRIKDTSILSALDNPNLIARQITDYGSLVEHLFCRYAEHQDSIGVVEKFSYYKPVDIQQITKLLPNAKFIHVIRDGRDVSLSWRSTWFGPTTVTEAALLWKKQIFEYSKLAKINPNIYMEIKYEDLLLNQPLVLDNLGSFLGTDLAENIDKFNNANFEALAEKEHYKKAAQALDDSNLIKWPRLMPKRDVALFEDIADDMLSKYAYPIASHGITKAATDHKFKDAISHKLNHIISVVKWKRRIMNNLPVVIWLSQKTNISPYSLLSKMTHQ